MLCPVLVAGLPLLAVGAVKEAVGAIISLQVSVVCVDLVDVARGIVVVSG